MNKVLKMLLAISLIMIPVNVMAMTETELEMLPMLIFMEAFVSIHMSIFVLYPLAEMFSKDDEPKKLFLQLFAIRVMILLIFDFFITPVIAVFDFMAVFVGAFIVVPICAVITKTKIDGRSNQVLKNKSNRYTTGANGELVYHEDYKTHCTFETGYCPCCGEKVSPDQKECDFCKETNKYY